jgi:hypothetical protein
MKLAQKGLLGSPLSLAVNSVHGVAFHRGLGEPLYATSSVPQLGYLDAEDIAKFSEKAYTKENVAVVANGASHSEFSKWVGEFFQDTPSGSKLSGPASKYYGGEERIAHGSGNVLIIGFEGSSSFTAGSTYKPEIAVLAALLGGQSTIKWSPGFSLLARAADSFPGVHISTQHAGYSDAGLLYITFTGNAAQIAKASKEAVETLKKIAAGDVAEEDIKKATALAKFKALEAGQQTQPGLEATGNGLIEGGKPFQIDEIGSSISQVSADKVKAVSAGIVSTKRSNANSRAGGEGSLGQQGISISRWRSIQTTICRRDWAEGLNRGSASWFGRAGWSVKLVNIRRRPKEDISKRVLRCCQDHASVWPAYPNVFLSGTTCLRKCYLNILFRRGLPPVKKILIASLKERVLTSSQVCSRHQESWAFRLSPPRCSVDITGSHICSCLACSRYCCTKLLHRRQ